MNMIGVKIAIVGSRRRTDEENVRKLVRKLKAKYGSKLILCSGGCRGVDSWALDESIHLGIKFKCMLPNLYKARNRYQIVQRYYKRNKEIAKFAVDGIYAFVAPDRKGGTENTIKHAIELGRKVIIK